MICDKVRDCEICLVTYRRNKRNRARRDSARHGLLVERPKIFERPSSSGEHDYLRPFAAAEIPNSCANLLGCTFSLYLRREQPDVQPGKAPFKHMQHVLNNRTGG